MEHLLEQQQKQEEDSHLNSIISSCNYSQEQIARLQMLNARLQLLENWLNGYTTTSIHIPPQIQTCLQDTYKDFVDLVQIKTSLEGYSVKAWKNYMKLVTQRYIRLKSLGITSYLTTLLNVWTRTTKILSNEICNTRYTLHKNINHACEAYKHKPFFTMLIMHSCVTTKEYQNSVLPYQAIGCKIHPNKRTTLDNSYHIKANESYDREVEVYILSKTIKSNGLNKRRVL